VNKEAKVGLFVLIGFILLFSLSTQVGSFKNLTKEGYRVSTYIKSAAGLEKNAKVKANGLDIGYIEDFKISGAMIKTKLFIYDGVNIPKDSVLRAEQGSMLGGKFINIALGNSNSYIEKDGVVKSSAGLAGFGDASDSLKKAADEFSLFMVGIREVFDEDSRKSLKNTIANIEVITNNFRQILDDESRASFKRTLVNIEVITKEFKKLANSGKMSNILNNMDIFMKDLRVVSADLREKVPSLSSKFASIADQIDSILKYNKEPLNLALKNAGNFFGEGESAIKKIDKMLATVDKVKLELGMRGEYQSSDSYNKGYLDLDYIPSDTKRYKFSIVGMDNYSQLDSSGSVIKPKKHENSNILISAQIAKRFGDLTLRTGLIESTVGAGADYHVFDDNLKFSAEVFDFNAQNDARGEKAHAKVSARYSFLKHIDIYGGYDNFLNKKSDNAFVGVGLHFFDDDLKTLIMSQSLGSMAK